MRCFYCRSELDDEATVCPHCGAYAIETAGSVDWYRAHDKPPMTWQKSVVLALAIALVVGLAGWLVFARAMDDSKRKADECVERVLQGGTC